MNKIAALSALLLTSTTTLADTTQTGPSTYTIDEGVSFTILNFSALDFLLTWSDDSGTFTSIEDPTITLTAGQTYIFDNNTNVHPFVITDDTLEVTGTDGSFSRVSFSGTDIDNATLQPIADFTADPNPADDVITWTPTNDDAGEYFYTCRVSSHIGMTGKIIVVAAPAACPADLTMNGTLDFFDVSAFLSAFTANQPAADFTGDGVYNFFDVSAFLSAFNAGCP
jgi:plastocyanin